MINFKHLIWVLLFFVTTVNAQNELDIATAEIQNSKEKYHLTDADLANWLVTDQYVSKQSGLTNIYLRQTHQGIEVTDANINIHIDASGKVAHKRSTFVPNLASRIKTNKTTISAEQAVKIAAAAHGLQPKGLKTTNEHPGYELIFNEAGIAMDPISAKLIYHKVTNKDIRLAWTIKIYTEDAQHQWITKIDAANGEILTEADGVIHCSFGGGGDHVHCIEEVEALDAHYKMLKGLSSPTVADKGQFVPNSYYVLPLGIESPNHGALATVVDPADALASPDGWHDDGGSTYTYTRGNNVYAQEDANGNNGFGYAPDGGANLEFVFNFNASAEPTPNRDVAITNLFYWNNLVHDLWYQHGFDEASGNFQENNFGRGGAGGDNVIADAQDGSGQNNANMSSGTDGANGRMQMYLWDATGGISAFEATSPGSVAGIYGSASAQFGAAGYNVSGTLVDVEPTEGCTAYTNAAAIAGNIALVDRGTCEFGIKCLNAQTAGAIAVVVCNNAVGSPINMAEGADGANVTIPALMISQADCATLRTGTNVMVNLAATTLPAELDGSMDAGIVAHEYGHGISTRITGGPGASCLNNGEQMGEGWSDFFGLTMTVLPGQTADTPRGIGTYAGAQGISGGGIRTYQYSRDMAVNPHTYDDIKTEAVPHGVGSVWCAMIWDMHWDLVDFYGYDTDLYTGTGGNVITMKLVVEGLRLQGCSPGFIDGRDAILAADEALYGGANKCIIWNSFARRGLGFSADQGGTGNTDGTEAFDLPPDLNGVSLVKTASLSEVEEGQVVTFTLQADNLCTEASNVIIVDDLPTGLTYVPNSASNGGTEAANTVTYPTLPSLTTGSSLTYTLDATVVNGSYFPSTDLLVDDMESGAANWSTIGGSGGANWALGAGTAGSCASTSWFAEDIDTDSRQYLTLAVPASPSGALTISFDHFYDTEANWDGGLVEISIDNGATWINLEDKFVQNGYNSLLDPDSVLGSENAFSGNSGGCITSIISACAYAREDVLIRFYFFTDAYEGGNGWYIDEVRISDEAAIINEASITSGDGANTIITRDDICIKILEGPLPIELLSFEATANARDISLAWKTANEINNEGFEIYRRSEFEADFTKIGYVAGAGNSTETLRYDFTDGNVRPNVSYYYQLKQIDFNGDFSLSDIEQARINDSGQAVVTLYPNPVKDGNLNLDIMTDVGQDVTISIYNIQGKLMLQEVHAGNTLTGTMTMDVSAFSAGVYVLKVATVNNVAYSDKFIKE